MKNMGSLQQNIYLYSYISMLLNINFVNFTDESFDSRMAKLLVSETQEPHSNMTVHCENEENGK